MNLTFRIFTYIIFDKIEGMFPNIELALREGSNKKLNQTLGCFRIQRQTTHNYFKNVKPNEIKFK